MRIHIAWMLPAGILGVLVHSWTVSAEEPSAEEAARNYHAYRACISRSNCRMTAQDWIDYYELKWELEEKKID